MSKEKHSRRVPEVEAATPDEVREAFNALSEDEHFALMGFARFRITRIGLAAEHQTAEDLLLTAFVSAMEGNRRWRKDSTDFRIFMKGAIRSISSNWAAKYRRRKTKSASDFHVEAEDGMTGDPVDNAADAEPTPEEVLYAKLLKERLREMAKGDSLRLDVLDAQMEGYTGAEIQELLEISRTEYDRARQWIHRARKQLAAALKSDL